MKKSLIGFMMLLSLVVSACQASPVEDTDPPAGSVNEISRETYLATMADEKNISYEEAEKLDEEQTLGAASASDEEARYVTLEKSAGSIYNGDGYIKTVYITVYAKYLYNTATGEPVELLEISAPYAYIPGISADSVTFDHGEYAITKDSSTKSTLVVIGSFAYTDPDVNISAGGNIMSVSDAFDGFTISTEPITLRAVVTLSDCAQGDSVS